MLLLFVWLLPYAVFQVADVMTREGRVVCGGWGRDVLLAVSWSGYVGVSFRFGGIEKSGFGGGGGTGIEVGRKGRVK